MEKITYTEEMAHMKGIAAFEKVSRERFFADWDLNASAPYDDITLPRRATRGSAGYDFFSPLDFSLACGESIRIPTGIRARIEPGWALFLFPRSGQGFKYRVMLYNTVGIVDSDYYGADNEGHIFIKLINANHENKTLTVHRGEAFAQGIFLPYGLTDDDCAENVRTGGFGSTDTNQFR